MPSVERDESPPAAATDENGDSEEAEYEVEQILDTKMNGRQRTFKVRWKGFTEEWDTWEPEDSLKPGAEEAMKEFMEEYRKKQKNGKKSRKRPAAPTNPTPSKATTTTRSRRSTVESPVPEEDASLADPTSDDNDEFVPTKSKKSKPNNTAAKTATSSSTSRGRTAPARTASSSPVKATTASTALSSNGFLSNNVSCLII
jgi:hypothetical protein